MEAVDPGVSCSSSVVDNWCGAPEANALLVVTGGGDPFFDINVCAPLRNGATLNDEDGIQQTQLSSLDNFRGKISKALALHESGIPESSGTPLGLERKMTSRTHRAAARHISILIR
ncbi:hypothetical protein L596_015809 [Steinernema carpocapsae]|uniref:Uncharacterized protein n=1 Tax=Steinernema carpocapsae TaxID=34508 RepID=A0A4U5NHB8_STECR|nr:hypothetical protein L596_015809 [Steinernema carpocapsae]